MTANNTIPKKDMFFIAITYYPFSKFDLYIRFAEGYLETMLRDKFNARRSMYLRIEYVMDRSVEKFSIDVMLVCNLSLSKY